MIYIYSLNCPATDAVRYIGKCKNIGNRLRTHISKARKGYLKHHCANWICTLLAVGMKPNIRVIQELPDGSDWQSVEMAEIRKHRDAGCNLTNLTAGGDGFHDVHPDVLVRRGMARRVFLSDPENYAKHLAMCREVQAKDEVKAKHSAAALSLWSDASRRDDMLASMRTPEAVKRRAAATRLRNSDPEFAEGHSKRMRALFEQPDARSHILAAGEKCRANPEMEARRKAAAAESLRRPETKALIAKTSAARWADPAYREKMKEACARGWEKRRAKKTA